MKCGSCLFVIILFATEALAQWAGNNALDSGRPDTLARFTLRGQIHSEAQFLGSATVELTDNGHSLPQSVSLEGDGSFEFHSVAPGAYELRVTGPGGGVLHQETVFVNGPNQILSITMGTQGRADRSAGPTVSIRQLQHKVPTEARRVYEKGEAAARKGDHLLAADHFRRAVTIDPEFADAYNGLGAAHLFLGQSETAVEQLQKAIELVPDHTPALANMSIALFRLKRFSEASETAKQALRLDPTLSKMRYILALSLTQNEGHEAEALDNLQRVAGEFPRAYLFAACILTQKGRPEDAANQLEKYLLVLSEHDPGRKEVEGWLATLRQTALK